MPPTPTKPQPTAAPKDDVASILGDMGLTSNQMSVVTNRSGGTSPPTANDAVSPDPLADLAESADALLRQMVDSSPKNGAADSAPASPPPSSSPPPNIEALDEHLADAVDSMLAIEREPSLPPPDPQASNAPPPQKFEAIAPGPVKEVEPPSHDPPPIAPKPAATAAAAEPTKPIEPAATVAAAPPPPPPPSMTGATTAKPNPAPSIAPAPSTSAKPPAHAAALQTAKGLTGATAKHGQSLLKAVEPPLLKAAAAISKPLSSKPKLVRDIVAGAALITLFWAGCVWLYVLALQPPAGPSAPKAHEETADAGGGAAGGHGEAKKDAGHGAKKDDGHAAKKTEKKKPAKKDAKKDAKASGGH